MRLAGSTLTFSRLTLKDALGGLVQLGFSEVELAALEGWAHLSPARLAVDADMAAEVASTLEQAQVRAVAINAGLGTHEPQAQGERLAALARLAARLGATVITIPAGAAWNSGERDRLAALVAAVRPFGRTLAVECHMGAFTEDPAVAVAACRAVPGLRLTLDASHYWAGPAQGRGWEAVVPFVAHVHLRDAGTGGWKEIQVAPGRGRVDFAAVLACLRSVGYTGAFAEEYIDTIAVGGGGTAAEAAEAIARLAQQWEA